MTHRIAEMHELAHEIGGRKEGGGERKHALLDEVLLGTALVHLLILHQLQGSRTRHPTPKRVSLNIHRRMLCFSSLL